MAEAPDNTAAGGAFDPVEPRSSDTLSDFGSQNQIYAEHDNFEDESPSRRWTGYVAPSLMVFALVAWTGFFGWTYLPEIQQGLGNERIVALLGVWTIPTLLIAVAWLLAMRNSQAEAKRFRNVAQMLRMESEALEARMRTVNEEISLAREFLAQNARDLETVGRQSARKLTDAAEQLSSALADSDQKAKTLETVSNAATSNLEQLRKHLPVVTSAAKDVTNQIGSAGNNAQLQIKSLIAGLERVGEAGKSARAYIDNMEARADEVSVKLEQSVSESALALAEGSQAAESRATAMVKLIDLTTGNMTSSISAVSADVGRIANESTQNLEAQLAAFRGSLGALADQSENEQTRISTIVAEIADHIETSAARIAEIDGAATEQTARLAFAVSALNQSTLDVGSALTHNKGVTEQLIERSAKLLSVLEAANAEIDQSIPAAMDRVDNHFAGSLAQLDTVSKSAEILDGLSDAMLAKLKSLGHLINVQRDNVGKLMSESDEHFSDRHEQADALASALTQTRALVEELTEDSSNKLVTSLLRVQETTKQVAESSRKIIDEELASVADRLSEQHQAALADAVDTQIAAINELIQGAVERNIALSETATSKMAMQLNDLNEMATNLEKRIADSKDGFEGVDDDSFARRMVLLTESLNSTAIDVAKILSNDVTDTAWAAYLKGDRGVFTRRAVRLLDAGEAKAIATHYGDDSEFREHVNRYIHDFEAMMRVLLSTRDGNAIGVTLLSSDVGKLYVALAQAIERLRN
ncbi:MAG: hypothetical protein WBO17_01220 [Sphingorhabdus sp.]